MIGRTLALYFARRFTVMVLGIFFFFFCLIAATTYLEFFMRSVKDAEFDALQVLLLALFRVPSVTEEVLPFTVLFGSIAAFVVANRRLEVVVARAAGISAWQFLLPACIVGLLIGIVATTLYNPASTVLRAWSDEISANLLSSSGQKKNVAEDGPLWLRQTADGRESIIGAAQTFNQGLSLAGVTAFVFETGGRFVERIDAPTAEFTGQEWRLSNATITAPSAEPRKVAVYLLPTALSPGQVRQAFDNVDSISFWDLPGLIDVASRAGIPTDRYELRYYTLLSRPVVLLAMVLIAAIVSLRFSRSRELGSMILAGVAVGFVLYVVSKVARDLGSGGIVPPPLAAWLPAIVTILMGATVLLHLEDG
ncbi:MAG TPA: LPS export ABC transporter permease LptG [Bauldia sp.]|nr:LPS export ABC transporter permease LptG [Bauldia sp.]